MSRHRAVRVAAWAVVAVAVAVGLASSSAWAQGLPEGFRASRGAAGRAAPATFPWILFLRVIGGILLIVVAYFLCFPYWFRRMLEGGYVWPLTAYGRALAAFALLVGGATLFALWPVLELKVLVPSLRRSPDISDWMNHWSLRVMLVPGITLAVALWGLLMHRGGGGATADGS